MKKFNEEEIHNIFTKIINKDKEAFNELYKKYYSLVYSIAFSIIKNKENSEDIAQNVFSKIYTLQKEKLPTKKELSWVYSVTKNETLNTIKKQKNMSNIEDVYEITDENTPLNDVIEKEIVSLKILSDLSFKEISQILNIPIGTVQWRYYTSLHTLKILLSNLSIFIISITLYIINLVKKVRKAENALAIESDVSNIQIGKNEEDKIQTDSISQDTEKLDNKTESSIQNEATRQEENEVTQEQAITNEVNQYERNIDFVNIGVLGISGISFIIIIVILIKYIKHQQKLK